jgi:hypothetical protein
MGEGVLDHSELSMNWYIFRFQDGTHAERVYFKYIFNISDGNPYRLRHGTKAFRVAQFSRIK